MKKCKLFIITLFIISLSSVNSFAQMDPKHIQTISQLASSTAIYLQTKKHMEKELKRAKKVGSKKYIKKIKVAKATFGILAFTNGGVYRGQLKSTNKKLRPHGKGEFYPNVLLDIANSLNFGLMLPVLMTKYIDDKGKFSEKRHGEFFPIPVPFTNSVVNEELNDIMSSGPGTFGINNIRVVNVNSQLLGVKLSGSATVSPALLGYPDEAEISLDGIDAGGNLADFSEMPFEKIEGKFKNGKLIIKIGKIRDVIYLDGFNGVERNFQMKGEGLLSNQYFNCERNSSSGECVLTAEGKKTMALAAIAATSDSGGDGM